MVRNDGGGRTVRRSPATKLIQRQEAARLPADSLSSQPLNTATGRNRPRTKNVGWRADGREIDA